eukprot:g3633.t1
MRFTVACMQSKIMACTNAILAGLLVPAFALTTATANPSLQWEHEPLDYLMELKEHLAGKFSKLDKNADGHLDRAEVGDRLQALDEAAKESAEQRVAADAKAVFANLTKRGGVLFADEDGDGKLGFVELHTLRGKIITAEAEGTPEEQEQLRPAASWLYAFGDREAKSQSPLSTTFVKHFEHNFAFADADGDSKLDARELEDIISKVPIRRRHEFFLSQSKEHFERADWDQDKSVTKDEWLRLAPDEGASPSVGRVEMEKYMSDEFDEFDTNSNGKLDAKEFASLYNPMATWSADDQRKYDLEFMFGHGTYDSSADTDRDGKLSKDELLQSSSSVLGRLFHESEIQDRGEL